MVQILQEAAPVGRKWRRPKHPFTLKTRPYDIVPFFIAPVLAGETMKNLLMQSRVVSDPVKNPLMGWWKEYYFFYVKLRDLKERDNITQMLLNPQFDTSGLRQNSGDTGAYHPAGGINWTRKCLERVVEEYFRDEGKPANEAEYGGYPQAYAMSADENWLDSLTLHSKMPQYDPDDTSGQADEILRAQWEFMRAQKLTNMTFEKYLETFGVNTPQEPNRPELVRYLREWNYPSNTINPVDGKPSSALSWSITERADKDRFFREPGFLFGVTVTRPKIFMTGTKGSAAHYLNDAFSWLPAIMRDTPETSLKKFNFEQGPAASLTDAGGYWVDMRDLFLYGDQFANFAIGDDDNINKSLIPRPDGTVRFMLDPERNALFKSATANLIREDGVVTLAVLGAQEEMT